VNLTTLQTLIAAGESLTLELKKSTAEKDRACRSLCALANGQGRQFEPHKSKPWNPWIAKVFHRRGIIETWGRGTLKIASLMQAAGLPVPTLQERTESVVMTFVLPDAMVQFRKSGTPGETLGKTLGKTPDLILKRLRDAPGSSIPELAQQLDKSSSAVERAIRKLRAQGKLQRIGPAKGGHWQVIE